MTIKNLIGENAQKVPTQSEPEESTSKKAVYSGITLHDSVTKTVNDYFNHLDGEPSTDVYHMVISQVESALFACVLDHFQGNQSKAANCLGISRGTLLKKMTQYKLHPRKSKKRKLQ